MSDNEVVGATALVTGASRRVGGRGIAAALGGEGARVAGAARDQAPLEEAQLGESLTAVSADATGPTVARQLIDAHRPAVPALNAGATPLPQPIQHPVWQPLGRNWDTDLRMPTSSPQRACGC
jgi:NAD(P)-dependent dehydrogenase (short-subunit alcohol dehydrogenase family)